MARLGGSPAQQALPPDMSSTLEKDELEERIRNFELWMANDRRQGPEKAAPRDRQMLLYQYEGTRATDLGPGGVNTRVTYVGFEKHSSKTPLEQLKRVQLEEMLVRKVHKGRYLLCRILALGVRQVGCQWPIEDPLGECTDLALYNYPTTDSISHPDLDALFPVGTVLAVREPTFKKATQGPFPMIRADSPSDIVLLRDGHPILKGITWRTGPKVPRSVPPPAGLDGWRVVGNAHFKARRWLPAAVAYTAGLALDEDASVLRLNRAEAYLRLGYHAAALKDAEDVTQCLEETESSHQKALLRAAKGLHGLGRYEGAERKLLELQKTAPDLKDFSPFLDQVRARLQESKTHSYDWCDIYKRAVKEPKVDASNYIGPVEVVVMDERGGGRGVKAKRTIQLGELLVVAKPFVSVFPEELPSKEVTISIDMLTKRMNKNTQTILISRVIGKMLGNPEQANVVTSLYAGPKYPNPPTSYPPVEETTPVLADPTLPAVDIDAAQIEGICSCNSFQPGEISLDSTKGNEDESGDTPSALYLFPSLFNHSCLANASWVCFGDLMVIRAVQNISEGEEITLAYDDAACPYSERERRLGAHLTQCQCELCKADRNDGETSCKRREDLLKKALDVDIMSTSAISRLRSIEAEIRNKYQTPRTTHPAFWKVPHRIAVAFEYKASQGDREAIHHSIEEQIRSLELLGVVVTDKITKGAPPKKPKRKIPIATSYVPGGVGADTVTLSMLTITHRFVVLGDDYRALRWLRAAMWIQDIVTGGGKELFELRWRSFMEKRDLTSFFAQAMRTMSFT